MNALESRVPPFFVVLAVAGLMWMAAAATPFLTLPFSARAVVAAGVAAVGLLTGLSGTLAFARARTSADPTNPRVASTLVVTGIYRFTRNPMYVGHFLLVVAWGLFLANILALALAPLHVLYITRFQIMPEERVLSALFGAEYAAYTARVRRWL